MQKVETYNGLIDAKNDMQKHIKNGWKIHTCTMGAVECGLSDIQYVLVVYEKNA